MTLQSLPNKAALAKHLAQLAKSREKATLLFLDLDGFKQVNDTKGHAAGDRCLERVVKIVEDVVAGKGKLYRWGGDEFAVVLRNFDGGEGVATAERIRRAIGDAKPGGTLSVSASIGVVESSRRLRNSQGWINAADQAMYESKTAGKDRVTQRSLGQETADVTPPLAPAMRARLLIELAEFAIHRLLNDPQNDSAKNLEARIDAWEDQVVKTLVEVGVTQFDRSRFRVLGTYSTQLSGRTAEHAKIRSQLAERIERLREIARQIEESGHPRR